MDPMARFHPDTGTPDSYLDHAARYLFALRYAQLGPILDAGTGTGYGAHLLASRSAGQVHALDEDPEAIAYARANFGHSRLTFHQWNINLIPWPFQSGLFSLVTAFEVLEHLQNPDPLLRESVRVLSENGILVVSTPDHEANPPGVERRTDYHLHEYTFPEFTALLGRYFATVRVYHQAIVHASRFFPAEGGPEFHQRVHVLPSRYRQATLPVQRAPWNVLVAVCTNGEVTDGTGASAVVLGEEILEA